MSRRYVKSIPLLSGGFETETELAIHALSLHMPIVEMPTSYRDRPHGSNSKLSTYRDGIRDPARHHLADEGRASDAVFLDRRGGTLPPSR